MPFKAPENEVLTGGGFTAPEDELVDDGPSLASQAVSAIQPEVQGPPQGNESFLSRLARGTRQTFFPNSMGEVKSALNPNLGQFGVSKILEEEGKRVGSAVRGSVSSATDLAKNSAFGQKHPSLVNSVYAPTKFITDAYSDVLTPSGAQQTIGQEGLGRVLPVVTSAVGRGASKLSELATGTKAREFQKTGANPSIFGKYLLPEWLGGDMSAKTAGARLGQAEKVFEGSSLSPEGRLVPSTTPQPPPLSPGISPGTSKVQQVGLSAYPDRPSFDSSITQHPEFIKAKSDAAGVLGRYAEKRGVKPTPEFADKIYHELHDNVHSALFGKTPAERKAIALKVKSDYPGIESDWPKISRKYQIDNQTGVAEKQFKKIQPNPLDRFVGQDNPLKANQTRAQEYFEMVRKGEKLTPKQMLEAYQDTSDYLKTVPRQDRRWSDMLDFQNTLQGELKRLSPEYAKATKDFSRAATGRAVTNVLPRTQTGKVSQGRVGFNAMLTGGASLAGLPAALAAFTVSSPVAHGAAAAGLGVINKIITSPAVTRVSLQAIIKRAREQLNKAKK